MGLIKDKITQEENKKLLANPRVQAMLRTIRYAEGATYNTRVGGSTFNDLSRKPGKKTYIPSIGDYSSAEGAYQFLNKTWDGVSNKLGLTDFSPQSQDIAAVELIKQRGALDDVLNDNFEQAVTKLSGEWASLPKSNGRSTYKNQRARSIQDLKNVFYNPKYDNQPEVRTQQQAPKQQEVYPYQEGEDIAMTNDLINFDFSMVNSTFVGEGVPDVYVEPKEEVKKAQEVLTQQQNEKNFLGDLSQQPPQEVQQAEEPQQQVQLPQIDLLDTFSQVSQFVDEPIAQEGLRVNPTANNLLNEFLLKNPIREVKPIQNRASNIDPSMFKVTDAEAMKAQKEWGNTPKLETSKTATPIAVQKYESKAKVKEQEITNGKLKAEQKITDAEYNSRSNDLTPTVLPDTINPSELKSKDKVKDVQQKLIDAGYNLNPEGKFSNNGADGFIGKITKQAIEDYNTYGESGRYTPYKDGEGLLGKCKEQQCSEFAQNEVFRNLKPNVSREEWNGLTGIYGDAWDIGKNIVEKGGKEVKPNQVKPGDVITVYTHGISPYQDEADAAGSGVTHTGIIDKVNPDGSYYILHNLHKGNKEDGFEGREYRDLVKAGEIQGHSSPYTVKNVYRPNYNSVKEYGKKANIRQDTQITIDDTNVDKIKNQSGNLLKSSPFEDSVQNASEYIKPLNNVENKKKLATKFGLDEDEYQSLVKSTLGILGQESKFGTTTYLPIKQAAASVLKSTVMGGEASKGAGQFKWEANNGDADLTDFGITEANFTSKENMPITMFNKIATNYKDISKTEKNKEKAIYKAIERYNRGKNTKYAEEFDSDYVNKVINFAKAFVVSDNNGKKFNTTLDKIALNRNVTTKAVN